MNTSAVARPRLHPMLWVAAASVTIFSAVGVAAVTGLLPGARGDTRPADEVISKQADTDVVPHDTANAKVADADDDVASSKAPTSSKAPVKVATHTTHTTPVHTNTPTRVAQVSNDTAVKDEPRKVAAICADCGVIDSIDAVKQPGQASGVGAVAGGVVGGLLGNNVGNGHGRDLATILGVAGGAYAGHQIEKSQRASTSYDAVVRMEDGSYRTLHNVDASWRAGDRVHVSPSGRLSLAQ